MLYNRPDLNGKAAVCYRRKSHEQDESQVLSLETQRDKCEEIVERFSLNFVQDFEEKKSAKAPDKRLFFKEMMKGIKQKKYSVIVCWRINRLARNMAEAGELVHLLQTEIIQAIITADKIYYPNDNTLMQIFEMAMATQYVRDLSRNVKDGLAKKARMGLPSGRAPIGFLNNKHKDKGERDWGDDPERWDLWQQVLKRILKGHQSPHQVLLWARNELELTTRVGRKRGGSLISSTVFYHALRRPEYANFFYHRGEKIALKCPELTPMISEDEYWRIQDILNSKGTPRPKTGLRTYNGYVRGLGGALCGQETKFHLVCDCKHKFSYRTKQQCPQCGKKISKMKHPIYRNFTYYYNLRRKKQGLTCRVISEKKIDHFLLGFAQANLTLHDEFVAWSHLALEDLQKTNQKKVREQAKNKSRPQETYQEQRKRAQTAFLKGLFSEEDLRKHLRELDRKEQSFTGSRERDYTDELKEIVRTASMFTEIMQYGSSEDKRELLIKMRLNLFWDEEKLSIIKEKWFETLCKGLKAVRAEMNPLEPLKSVENKGSKGKYEQVFPLLCRVWENVRTEYPGRNADSEADFGMN